MKHVFFFILLSVLYACQKQEVHLVGAWQFYADDLDIDVPVYYEFYFFNDSSMFLINSYKSALGGTYVLKEDTLKIHYPRVKGVSKIKVANENFYKLISTDISDEIDFKVISTETLLIHRFNANYNEFYRNDINTLDSSRFRKAFYKRREAFIKIHPEPCGKIINDTTFYQK